jgi:hypothetical protein
VTSSATRTRSRFAGFGARPVMLSSPHPASECLRRLTMVTSHRGSTWYLDPRNAVLPDPRFRGDAGPSWISLARFEDAAGRNSFVPWLQGRLEPAAGGGTTIAGSVGLNPAVKAVIPVIAGGGGLIALSALAGGVALLAAGHLSGLLPAVLIPLALITLLVSVNVVGMRSLEREIPKLIQEVNGILDSTATFLGRAAIPGTDGHGV